MRHIGADAVGLFLLYPLLGLLASFATSSALRLVTGGVIMEPYAWFTPVLYVVVGAGAGWFYRRVAQVQTTRFLMFVCITWTLLWLASSAADYRMNPPTSAFDWAIIIEGVAAQAIGMPMGVAAAAARRRSIVVPAGSGRGA